MPRFVYEGFDNGEPVKGNITAASLMEAEQKLMERQILVDQLDPVGNTRKFKESELINFTQGMASLLRAGVPLADAGDLWTEDLKHADRWEGLFAQLREGVPFSEAMARGDRFPTYLVAMVRIGEATGTLGRSFDKSAQYLIEKQQLRQLLVSALIYPLIVLFVAAVAMIILFVYVLPVFEDMYRKFDADLPMLTKMLMSSLDVVERWGLIIVLVAGGLGYLVTRHFRAGPARDAFDGFLYKIPLFGPFLSEYHQTFFCQSMGHLLDSGVGLLEALDIVAPILPNHYIRSRVMAARVSVARGVSLAQALEEEGALPRKLTKMIGMAEQSGELSRTLLDLGEMLRQSVNGKLKNFAGIFEPVLILFLAVVIGFVLVALYLPMFDIVQIME